MNSKKPQEQPLRGVNLGGWLVLEKWMTPSLFKGTDAIDEFSFMQTPEACERLAQHRATFITEEDFQWIASHGLNAVRIPVGYWLPAGDPPYTSGIEYLDWAMKMAEKYHLSVLLDLHGAPGSQNGNDHSGRVGRAEWYADRECRAKTVKALKVISQRYADSPALWGVELLNEPNIKLSIMAYFTLKWFYREAYEKLSPILRPGTRIVFSDAFVPRLFSGVLKANRGLPVVMDVHWYQFGKTNIEHYWQKLAKRSKELARLQSKQPVIVGEWSGMLSHHTLAGLPGAEKARLQREHIHRQLNVYDSALGWFYWTYKTEGNGIWNYRSLVESGEFPVI